MSAPDLLARFARSLTVNVRLMRAFRRSPMDFLDVLVDSGASTIPLRMGPERVLLVDDATQVWELLTTHARRTGKGRGLVRARLLLGEGLLTSEGDRHLRHRRALQPAFHPQRISDYLAHFARAARHAADRWSDGGDIDLVAEMSAMTLDGAGAALFGSDLRAPAPQITRALTNLLAGFRLAMAPGGPTLLRSPLPVAIRVRSAKVELENVVDDLIRGRWAGEHCARTGAEPAGFSAGTHRWAGPGRGDDVAAGRARDDGHGPHLGPGRDRPGAGGARRSRGRVGRQTGGTSGG